MRLQCTGCGGTVELDTEHLGPAAARGLLEPLRALCSSCVVRIQLHTGGPGRPWLLWGGEEFRELGGAFVRSDNPAAKGMYYRDEKREGAKGA